MGEKSKVLFSIFGILDVTGEVVTMWIILAVIATILFGCVGILIGMQCNLGGDLGIIFSITTMGAFILEAITNRK